MVVIVVATPNKAVSTTPVMREVQKTMRFVAKSSSHSQLCPNEHPSAHSSHGDRRRPAHLLLELLLHPSAERTD